jgi:hypothetical protein
MFVNRNLTRAERAAVDNEHGPQDWAHFGSASDEDGLAFIEEHIIPLSNDAKQVRAKRVVSERRCFCSPTVSILTHHHTPSPH